MGNPYRPSEGRHHRRRRDELAARRLSVQALRHLPALLRRGRGGAVGNLDIAKRARRARPAFVNGVSAHHRISVFMGDRMGVLSDTEFADHDGELHRRPRGLPPGRHHRPGRARSRWPSSTTRSAPSSSRSSNRSASAAAAGAAAISDEGGWDLEGGWLAVNPSGGTLCTNPIGVTGLVRVVDAAQPDHGQGRAPTRSRTSTTRSPPRSAARPNSSPSPCWATTTHRRTDQ